MAIADSHGLPIAVGITSASPNESTLVENTLDQRHIAALPKRLIGDKPTTAILSMSGSTSSMASK